MQRRAHDRDRDSEDRDATCDDHEIPNTHRPYRQTSANAPFRGARCGDARRHGCNDDERHYPRCASEAYGHIEYECSQRREHERETQREHRACRALDRRRRKERKRRQYPRQQEKQDAGKETHWAWANQDGDPREDREHHGPERQGRPLHDGRSKIAMLPESYTSEKPPSANFCMLARGSKESGRPKLGRTPK